MIVNDERVVLDIYDEAFKKESCATGIDAEDVQRFGVLRERHRKVIKKCGTI